MSTDTEIIKQVENLIIGNKLVEATNKLRYIFETEDDEDLLNESILLLSRLVNFNNKANQGVVDYFDLEFSKIRLSVINLKSSAKKLLSTRGEDTSDSHKIIKRDEINTIFKTNFEHPDDKWEISGELTKAEIKNRRCFIEHLKNDRGGSFTKRIPIDTSNNFSIKCNVQFLEGTEANGYGLRWGGGEGVNYFDFVISANGSFTVGYFLNDEPFDLCDWTKNDAIKRGKKSNTLEIIKNKSLLHFKINEEVVFTTEFIPFFGDVIGFQLYKNMKVVVSYFEINN